MPAAVVLMALLAFLAACGAATPSAAPPAAVAEATVTQPAAEPQTALAEEAAAPADEVDPAAEERILTFVIDPAQSQARFTLDELLMGNPKTVVGVTSGVAGQVTVNLNDHSLTEIGPIQIDARSLETDDNMRNRALRRMILASEQDAYQYIVYTPTVIEGLPETVTVGEPFEFTVTGDLKIRDITHPVTFAMTVTPRSETEVQGGARATVQRADFDLSIPNVPSVANVSEEVLLEFDFVAQVQ